MELKATGRTLSLSLVLGSALQEKIAEYINSLSLPNSTPKEPRGQGVFEVADRSFDAM